MTALLLIIIFILLCVFYKQVGKGIVVVAGVVALLFIIGTLSGPGDGRRTASSGMSIQQQVQWCRDAKEMRDAAVAALLVLDGTEQQRIELAEALAETQRKIEAIC